MPKKLTLADLKKLREAKVAEFNPRDMANKDVQVIVGMGTCGIAAGAKEAFDAFVEELEHAGLSNVAVRQTGCMGPCHRGGLWKRGPGHGPQDRQPAHCPQAAGERPYF